MEPYLPMVVYDKIENNNIIFKKYCCVAFPPSWLMFGYESFKLNVRRPYLGGDGDPLPSSFSLLS